jgi:hypothetical protein
VANYKKLTLEMSLKPFKNTDPGFIEKVCRRMFTQWQPLLSDAEEAAVLLWTADGSEILDYSGNLENRIEWAYFIGGAVRCTDWDREKDPQGKGLHTTNYPYTESPPEITYGILKEIIRIIKEIGSRVLGKKISVGATFDPGPEFALSDFKYNRHREILIGESMGKKSMVCCFSRLHADSVPYAAWPAGIPEGTPFGTFFGRQAQRFLRDLGFDYLWLSNGFGFGTETWGITGSLFDGKTFSSGRLEKNREQITGFWRLFRQECDYRVETRGTNLTAGIDFATDGVDLSAIYSGGFDLLPPPNSPWAAIDGDFGLELAGYMSRVAGLPDNEPILFRFYIHDPWWMNSPWEDRYERQPHDIYLPLALSRVTEEGDVQTPEQVNLLTVDNSLGEMPELCAAEPAAHIAEAYRTLPDSPAPFVWVYPFEEYFHGCGNRLTKPFFEDSFLCGAVNNGLPVSTVVSSDIFKKLMNTNPGLFSGCVLISPVPNSESGTNGALLRFLENGGNVLLYGSLRGADGRWVGLLGLTQAPPLYGKLTVVSGESADRIKNGLLPEHVRMSDTRTDGGSAEAQAGDGAGEAMISLTDGRQTRVAAAVSRSKTIKGRLGWVRGSDTSRLPREESEYPMAAGLRTLLPHFGYTLSFDKPTETSPSPVMMMHRCDNALWMSGYQPDTTVKIRLKTPLGAPLFPGNEGLYEAGCIKYTAPRAWRAECRAFLEQEEDGVISCRILPPVSYFMKRRYLMTGLKNATVRVLVPKNSATELLGNADYPYMVGETYAEEIEQTAFGPAVTARGVTGRLLVSFYDVPGDREHK